MRTLTALCLASLPCWGAACSAETESKTGPSEATASDAPVDGDTTELPALGELIQVVPSAGLPPEVIVQPSANNLDILRHDGADYFAFRTAPSHFASAETVLYVLRSDDGRETWSHELTLDLGTDLREPRFLSLDGQLILYFAVLGTNPADFEPQGTMLVERRGPSDWTAPERLGDEDDTLIPWRLEVRDGRAMMLGYRGGEGVYDFDSGLAAGNPGIEVVWLGSEDGRTWTPWVEGAESGVVHVGGGSETSLAFLDDGSIVAVMRNEAGDEDGWGSKVCTAPAGDLGTWTCAPDPKKYDSPLVFAHNSRVWLIGRRNLTDTGHYDLEQRDLDHTAQTLAYQGAYWNAPKRCALWEVDPTSRTVAHVLDLPSKGDTCFPSVLPLGGDVTEVWNYSSDPARADDPTWIEGQTGETRIYRQTLTLP